MTSARELDGKMTAEAFITWSDRQVGRQRFELLDGLPYLMSSEQALHARVKFQFALLLRQAILANKKPCEVFIAGMAVRVDGDNVFEPDVTVVCGDPVAGKTVLLQAPLIVVEVGSPSTQRIDATVKLARYFRNPHIVHYLIVVPTARSIVHHRRDHNGAIVTTSYDTGSVVLDPPALELALADVFAVIQD